MINIHPEPQDLLGDVIKGAPLDEVIQTSHKEDSHGSGLPVVVNLPRKQQILDPGSWDGKPVNMRAVWGADNSRLPRLVELMELTGAHTDVQPIVQPGQVAGLACGAEVVTVSGGILSTLQHPDLASRPVAVVDLYGGLREGLAVGAEHALGWQVGHRVPVGHQLAKVQTGHSRH